MTEAIGLSFDLSTEQGRRELARLKDSLDGVNRTLEGGKSAAVQYEGGMKGAEDATKKQGSASLETAGSTEKLTASTLAMHPAVIGVTAALGAMVAGLGAAIVAVKKALEAWDEQATVNNEVEVSLRNLGFSAAEAREELGRLSSVAGELAGQTLFGDEAILAAIASLNQWRTSAASASEVQAELNIALGVAQSLNMEAAQAAKEYARAAGGNVGAAEKLLGLTEEQKKSLTELKDVSERAAIIQDLLREKFEGAAQAVDPYQLAMSRLNDAQGDLWQAFGQGIAQSGAFEPVLEVVTGALRELEGWVLANQDAVRDLAFRGVNAAIDGFDGLLGVLQFVSPAIVGLATYLELTKNWFGLVFDAVGLVGRGLYTLGAQYISFVTGRLETLLGAFASVAEFVDDDFGAKLRSASAAMGEFSDRAQGVAVESFAKMKADTLEAGGNIDGMIESLANAPGRLAALNAGIENMRARVETLRAAMANAQDSERSESGGGAGSARVANGREELKQAEAALKALEDETAALALRDELARRKLSILQEEDEMRRIQLEYEMALFELDQQNLTAEEIVLGTLQAQYDLREKTLAIEEKRAAEARRLADLQVKAAADAAKAQDALKKQADATARSQFSMWMGIGDLAADAFGGAIKSAGALAALRAVMFGAEAIGALVWGNFVGAAAAGKAAAEHLAAAAMAGVSSPGVSSASGGGGFTPSTGGGGSGSAREIGQTIAEELNRQQGNLSSITIVNDWRGATLLEDTPAIERRLADAVRRSLRVDGIRLGAN